MIKLRVTEKEFNSLFEDKTGSEEKSKVKKRLKLMCIDYPVVVERVDMLERMMQDLQIKAGKYDKIAKSLKLPPDS